MAKKDNISHKLVKICCAFVIVMTFATSAVYAGEFNFFVTKDKATADKWFNVRGQDRPSLSKAEQILSGQNAMMVVTFSDPGIDVNGRAKISYDLKIRNENNDVMLEQNNIKVIDAKITPGNIFRLGVEMPLICFDDAPGKYSLQATFRDEIDGTVQMQQSDIILKKYSYSKYFYGEKAYKAWVNNYHMKFDTERALDGLIYFAQYDNSKKNYYFACGFYSKIINDNPYLIPDLLKLIAKQNDEAKSFIFALLSHINYDFTDFLTQLDESDKILYEKNKDKCLLRVKNQDKLNVEKVQDTVDGAAQMDFLWGRFFAGGEYAPVKQMTEFLALSKYKGSLDKYKQTKNAADEKAAMGDLLFQAARWSLRCEYKESNLVKKYCDFIYENEALPAEVKQEFKAIIES